MLEMTQFVDYNLSMMLIAVQNVTLGLAINRYSYKSMISFCYFPMFVVTLRIPSMFCSVSLLASLLF